MLKPPLRLAVAAGSVLLLVAGVRYCRSLALLTIVVTRSAGCSLPDALLAVANSVRQNELSASLRRTSRLTETDSGGFELWTTPDGDYWIPKGADLFYVLAEQQRELYGDADHGVQRGDVVLDCGANVGVFTRKALERGASKVVAIEPVPASVEALRRTFRGELGEGRVIVYPKGIWDTAGVLRMWTYQNSVLDSFVLPERPESAGPGEARDLPVTTIDFLAAELKLERVDFIKIDIEGGERRAIAGARSTLSRFRPRLAIATENLSDDYKAIPAAVRGVQVEYAVSFGACRALPDGSIRPEVVFFRH